MKESADLTGKRKHQQRAAEEIDASVLKRIKLGGPIHEPGPTPTSADLATEPIHANYLENEEANTIAQLQSAHPGRVTVADQEVVDVENNSGDYDAASMDIVPLENVAAGDLVAKEVKPRAILPGLARRQRAAVLGPEVESIVGKLRRVIEGPQMLKVLGQGTGHAGEADMKTMGIGPVFWSKAGGKVGPATLVDSETGKQWTVQLIDKGSKGARISNGFETFVQENDLRLGTVLMLEVKAESHFLVYIISKGGDAYHAVASVPKVLLEEQGKGRANSKVEEGNEESRIGEADLDAATLFASELGKPCLIKRATPSMVTGQYVFWVPHTFATTIAPESCTVLVTASRDSQRQWSARLDLHPRNQWLFQGVGWCQCVQALGIRPGDIVVFESWGKQVLHVHTFKGHETGKVKQASIVIIDGGVANQRKISAKRGRKTKGKGKSIESGLSDNEKGLAAREAEALQAGMAGATLVRQLTSYQAGGSIMSVPGRFACHLTLGGITLETTSSSTDWLVRLHLSKANYCFTAGWPKFIKDNNMQEGDAFLFEIIDQARLKVHIFRKSEVMAALPLELQAATDLLLEAAQADRPKGSPGVSQQGPEGSTGVNEPGTGVAASEDVDRLYGVQEPRGVLEGPTSTEMKPNQAEQKNVLRVDHNSDQDAESVEVAPEGSLEPTQVQGGRASRLPSSRLLSELASQAETCAKEAREHITAQIAEAPQSENEILVEDAVGVEGIPVVQDPSRAVLLEQARKVTDQATRAFMQGGQSELAHRCYAIGSELVLSIQDKLPPQVTESDPGWSCVLALDLARAAWRQLGQRKGEEMLKSLLATLDVDRDSLERVLDPNG